MPDTDGSIQLGVEVELQPDLKNLNSLVEKLSNNTLDMDSALASMEKLLDKSGDHSKELVSQFAEFAKLADSTRSMTDVLLGSTDDMRVTNLDQLLSSVESRYEQFLTTLESRGIDINVGIKTDTTDAEKEMEASAQHIQAILDAKNKEAQQGQLDPEVQQRVDSIGESWSKVSGLLKEVNAEIGRTPAETASIETNIASMQAQFESAKVAMNELLIDYANLGGVDGAKVAEADLIQMESCIEQAIAQLDEYKAKLESGDITPAVTATTDLVDGVIVMYPKIADSYDAWASASTKLADAEEELKQKEQELQKLIFEEGGAGTEKHKELSDTIDGLTTRIVDLREQVSELEGSWNFDGTEDMSSFDSMIQSVAEHLAMLKPSDVFAALSAMADSASDALFQLANAMDAAFSSIANSVRSVGGFFWSMASTVRSAVGNMIESLQKLATTIYKTFTLKYGLGKSIRQFARRFLMLTVGIYSMRSAFSKLRRAAIAAFQSMAKFSSRANTAISTLKMGLGQLKGQIGGALEPLLVSLQPILSAIIARLTAAAVAVTKFVGALMGLKQVLHATQVYNDYAASVGNAQKKLKDLAGFDEINRLSDPNAGGGGGGADTNGWEWMDTDDFGLINKFKKLLADLQAMWEASDFSKLGMLVGEVVKSIFDKLIEKIPFLQSLLTKLALSLGTFINGLMSVPDLGLTIGTAIGRMLNAILSAFNTLITTIDFSLIANQILGFFTGLFTNIDPTLIAQTLANVLQAAVTLLATFISGIDFGAIASYLSTIINTFFEQLGEDNEFGESTWETIGKTIFTGVTGLLKALTQLLKEVNWAEVGTAIGELLGQIDWGALVIDLSDLAKALVDAIVTVITNWKDTDAVSASIAGLIAVALGGLKVLGWVAKIGAVLLAFFAILAKFIGLDAIFAVLQTAIMALLEVVGSLGGVFSSVGTVIVNILTAIQPVVEGLMAFIAGNAVALLAIVAGLFAFIVSFFDMLKNGFSWVKEIIMWLGIAVAAVGVIIIGSITGAGIAIVAAIGVVIGVIATAVILIKEHWEEIKDTFFLGIEALKQIVSVGIETMRTNINTWITTIKTAFSNFWAVIKNVFSTSLNTIKNFVVTVFNAIKTNITNILNAVKSFISSTWNAIKANWMTMVKTIKQEGVVGLFGAIKTFIKNTMVAVRDNIRNMLVSIKTTWQTTFNTIKTATANVFTSMWTGIKKTLNAMLGGFETVANGAIKMVNTIIDALNGLKIDVPDWVSEKFGIQDFGFNIPSLNTVSIPRLAKGAVLPPNQPFLSIVGDQSHGTNVEAPLDTIKQAVAEELAEQIDAMMAGFQAVVDAINNKDLSISENAIGKAANHYNTRQNLVRGR